MTGFNDFEAWAWNGWRNSYGLAESCRVCAESPAHSSRNEYQCPICGDRFTGYMWYAYVPTQTESAEPDPIELPLPRHAMLPAAPNSIAGDQRQKLDAGKAPWHLLPFDALASVVAVLAFGAQKYSVRGWEAGIDFSRLFSAAMRHMTAWWYGEDTDPETGISHLAHAVCCLLFLLAFVQRRMSTLDDRPRVTLDDAERNQGQT